MKDKLNTETRNFNLIIKMVVEFSVYFWRLIGKLVWNCRIKYADMSSIIMLLNIITVSLRFFT